MWERSGQSRTETTHLLSGHRQPSPTRQQGCLKNNGQGKPFEIKKLGTTVAGDIWAFPEISPFPSGPFSQCDLLLQVGLPPPRLWLIRQGCFITFKVWVMLAPWWEAPCAEELGFPGSDAPSQGEDAGAGRAPVRRWDRFGCSSAERCRVMPPALQEPQPISASSGMRLQSLWPGGCWVGTRSGDD